MAVREFLHGDGAAQGGAARKDGRRDAEQEPRLFCWQHGLARLGGVAAAVGGSVE